MKHILVLLVAMMMILGATSAWALDVAGFGSYSSTTDIGDAWGLGAKLDVNFGQSLFFGEARVSYFPEYEKTIAEQDVKFSALPLELGIGARFSSLFASAGLSYFVKSNWLNDSHG